MRKQLVFLSLLLSACSLSTQPPVQVCQSVTETLLGFELPVATAMDISEQEIRGERIVTHLKFKRPADNYPVHVICVFAAEKYATANDIKQLPYSEVPTRMAVNNKQVTENDLNAAIVRSGFELD